MINGMLLKNFQSHEHTKIEFAPGVNVIVGRSDSGKSAILRALNWVRTNRPSGNAFRSVWGGETVVALYTDEGQVFRQKSASKTNKYRIMHKGTDTTFKAMGQSVPEQVTNLLQISDINFQSQMEGPFLLSKNPGEVARFLNQITNLDVIDTALSQIFSKLRDVRWKKKQAEERVEELYEQAAEYHYLEGTQSLVEKLEKKQTSLDRLIDKRHRLENLRRVFISKQAEVDGLKHITAYADDAVYFKDLFNDLLNAEEGFNAIRDLSRRKSRTVQNITRMRLLLKHKKVLIDLEKKHTIAKDKEGQQRTLVKLVERQSWLLADCARLKAVHASALAEFNKIMPDICPLCKQAIPREGKHGHSSEGSKGRTRKTRVN